MWRHRLKVAFGVVFGVAFKDKPAMGGYPLPVYQNDSQTKTLAMAQPLQGFSVHRTLALFVPQRLDDFHTRRLTRG
jgi:hypothetical protein